MLGLNYHHLRYFREVALEGNLTRAAERLNVSQSALSSQIKQLEERLGHALFERRNRKLVLTEAGAIALDHADRIFASGEELLATLRHTGTHRQTIRIGALSTLSRNFQIEFLRPVLGRDDVDIVLRSGGSGVLYEALQALTVDIILTTEPPRQDSFSRFTAHRIAEQKVEVYGTPRRMKHATLTELLTSEPVILPTESAIRTGFESLISRLGITPQIAAEVDDMAMVRLLARADFGLAISPAVVFADELRMGMLTAGTFDLDIVETFYAVTTKRSFPNPVVAQLLTPPDPR